MSQQEKEKIAPKIGMGCTVCWLNDTKAATVIEINESGKTIRVQEDHSRVTKPSPQYGFAPEYSYEPNPEGRTWTFRLGRSGRWKELGGSLVLGLNQRRTYQCPEI